MKFDLRNIFLQSLKSVNSGLLIKSAVSLDCNKLKINEKIFKINNNCYLVGFGKAVYEMAVEMENILGKHLQKGIITVPHDLKTYIRSSLKKDSVVTVFEGGKNNLPDENSLKASLEIKNLVIKCEKTDFLIVLISGGGSALLSYPIFPITLAEKVELIKNVTSAGANIEELNTVRKVLSELKGGKLAALAYPATVVALILSDIVGDPLDFIASGPTILPNKSTKQDALTILKKYNLMKNVNENIKQILYSPSEVNQGTINHLDNFLYNIIIGNNLTFMNAAKKETELLGCNSIILSNQITGFIDEVAKVYIHIIKSICSYLNTGIKITFLEQINELCKQCETHSYIQNIVININKNLHVIDTCYIRKSNLCLIAGGEPTVELTGNGTGGRNQELTLKMALELHKLKISEEWINKLNIFFMSAGTDGIDGPTDAAGAITDINLIEEALIFNFNPEVYLENNDSYTFFSLFKNGSQLIKTGHTGTNVMDVHFLLFNFI